MEQKTVKIGSPDKTSILFGSCDENMKIVEARFSVNVQNCETDDGDAVLVSGEKAVDVERATAALTYLVNVASYNDNLSDSLVNYVCDMVEDGKTEELTDLGDDCICVTCRGKPVKAVKALREKQVSRIILSRPAIEAGEKLGFLPGDLQSKIDPYLRPLYDALYEMMGPENYQRHVEKQTIEIAPLAYMRGRTLDDSFIILDEAQNATPEQMKMFLTRLGFNSKAVVTGDLTQTDLPSGQSSGLATAVKILDHIDGIAIHRFTDRDVVRNKLVQKIILAYEKYDRENAAKHAGGHGTKFRYTSAGRGYTSGKGKDEA